MTRSREIIDELHTKELEVLRAERDVAIADLRVSRRECEILRGSRPGVGASVGYELCPPRRPVSNEDPDASEERMAMLEHAVRALDAALFDISIREDCCCEGDDRKKDDTYVCTRCIARHALKLVAEWRHDGAGYRPSNRHAGSYPERTNRGGHYPREAKMHAAWKKKVNDDYLLAQILGDKRPAPSARDWYVATSVVQWLATNVGMGILEEAGFKYTQYDDDWANERKRELAARHTAEEEQPKIQQGAQP